MCCPPSPWDTVLAVRELIIYEPVNRVWTGGTNQTWFLELIWNAGFKGWGSPLVPYNYRSHWGPELQDKPWAVALPASDHEPPGAPSCSFPWSFCSSKSRRSHATGSMRGFPLMPPHHVASWAGHPHFTGVLSYSASPLCSNTIILLLYYLWKCITLLHEIVCTKDSNNIQK